MNILKIFQYLVLICNLAKPSFSSDCQYNQTRDNNKTYNVECTSTKELSFNISIPSENNNLKIKGSKSNELLKYLLNNSIELISSLDLSSNQLNDINELFNSDNNLKNLNLSNNMILMIKEKQFFKFNKLEILDLSFNQIFYIEMNNAFYGLNNLLELNLSNNHLTELYEGNLDNLPQCKLINLDSNKINRIKRFLFTKMISIKIISFQFNRLQPSQLHLVRTYMKII
jgi:Leucine-rich repeat (LRR) protein